MTENQNLESIRIDLHILREVVEQLVNRVAMLEDALKRLQEDHEKLLDRLANE